MDLKNFKIYYNSKCKILKNHEGQQNYAILRKKCIIKFPVK